MAMKRAALSVAVAAVALCAAYLWYVGAFSSTRTELWLIPLGFKGWIVVEYRQPACPPLERSGDWLTFKIPASGRLCTSNTVPEGFAHRRFEHVLSNGLRVPILEDRARSRGVSAGSQGRDARELLFVGTAEEEEAALSTMPAEFR